MRDKMNKLFAGRQGMDEFSKFLFWSGCAGIALSCLLGAALNGALSSMFFFFGSFMLILGFVRAFSRKLQQREMENTVYLQWLDKKRRERAAACDRRRQKDYRFFKCPGCGQYLRVPKGKGKIHIKCRCGYTLYRKT